ncbi:MAG: hypothetical protein FJ320_07570 [SAR202 cluster bacterium]|nr:hypothetical protein [SAR202 cluster bacterium]
MNNVARWSFRFLFLSAVTASLIFSLFNEGTLAVEPQASKPARDTSMPTVTVEVDPSANDGIITSSDGRVRVTVPKGATNEPLRLELTALKGSGDGYWRITRAFEINAYARTRGDAKVSQFARDVEFRWNFSDAEIAGLETRSLRMFYFDEATGQWVTLTS